MERTGSTWFSLCFHLSGLVSGSYPVTIRVKNKWITYVGINGISINFFFFREVNVFVEVRDTDLRSVIKYFQVGLFVQVILNGRVYNVLQ